MCTCVSTVGEEDIAVNRGIGKGEKGGGGGGSRKHDQDV